MYKFICANEYINEYDFHVPAPLFKRTFRIADADENANPTLQICCVGFYRAFINGKEITKGRLAPFISNPDHIVYYDTYCVKDCLHTGENVLHVLLGNGFANPIGGEVWELDKAPWRSAPKFSAVLTANGKTVFETDEKFLVSSSPVTFDDLWAGERFDARIDSFEWKNAALAMPPKGELRDGTFAKIEVKAELSPKKIIPVGNGFVYDFGINTAGVCRLRINAKSGLKISMQYFEIFDGAKVSIENISFGTRTRKDYWQRDEYICKDGYNEYEPSFTYHGFRYVYVEGLTEKQATESALTMIVLGTSAKRKLTFACSDKRIERLVENVMNSNYSNFMYFPTDCPQREKNGWTGDAMLSAEQMLYSMDVKDLLKEWLFAMRKAQKTDGDLPRIVPCGEWGFSSGESGPAWDGAIIEIPYRIYEIDGDESLFADCLPAAEKYLKYLNTRKDENGLLGFGLGDREETFSRESSAHETPNTLTDTLIAIELCEKTARMAEAVGKSDTAKFARDTKKSIMKAFRENCIDGARVKPFTQTGQCLAINAGIFDKDAKEAALDNLLLRINENGGKPKAGVLGYRYLFETLAENGMTKLAYDVLLGDEYPGYLYYAEKGMTSMPESFVLFCDGSYARKDGGKIPSLNHHWYGHILASIIKYVVGIRADRFENETAVIEPCFVSSIDSVSAETEIRGKKIFCGWRRVGKNIEIEIRSDGRTAVLKANARYKEIERKRTGKTVKYVIAEK